MELGSGNSALTQRSRDEIELFFPKFAQKMTPEKIDSIIKVLEAYNK